MADRHHSHGHKHDHTHHGHSHAPVDFGKAFIIGITLNLIFVFVEVGYGIFANSMSLIADAGHNLGDVLGLVVAWIASILAKRKPSARFTYGLRSSSILAALTNAVLLLVATGAIAVEAVQRFANPEPVAGGTIIIVATIGILINGLTAMMFMRGRHNDLNIRGAYLHLMADAGVSAGVVVAGIAILYTDMNWIDPVASLLIGVIILVGTWGLLRDSMKMSLHGVPPGIDPMAVRGVLESQPGVKAIHDLHIWSMSTTEVALTCHLIMPEGHPGDMALRRISEELHQQFRIEHTTMQIETDDADCALHDHAV